MRPRRSFSCSRLLAGALVLWLSGCGKEAVVVQTPGTLTLVQGNMQAVQGGMELPNPIVVRLLDTQGAPIAEAPIGFSVAAGGGAVTPGSVTTDENGEAKTRWVLGTGDANQSLHARAAGLDPLVVSATALLPTDLVIAQGSNQSARISAGLPNPLVIRILGPNNTPMKGITVAFQVVTGGGQISPQSALTNALGEVTARWTLGPTAGMQQLSVSSGTLQPITVQAMATP